jgi:multisubunit Na+/H+ antiporter MnhC subunit
MYLTNYVHVVTMGMLFRSAKPMLAPVVIGTAFYLAALVQNSSRETLAGSCRTGRAPVVVFVLFCIMSLLDRQGFFLALIGFSVLLLNAVFAGGRRDVVAGGAAAMAAMVFYNLIGAPFIIESLNGYRPSFEFQRIPLDRLADPRAWLAAGWLLLHAASVLLGGIPIWVVAGLVLALGSWAVLPRSGVPRKATLLCAAVALGLLVMFAGMVARHPPIYMGEDHRLWYYPLPFQALVLVGIVVALDLGGAAWSRTRAAALNLTIAAAVLANVAHWNGYRAAQLRSWWFPTVYEQTAALKSSLADSRPLWYLTPEYLGFYRFTLSVSPVFRAGADAKPAGDAP